MLIYGVIKISTTIGELVASILERINKAGLKFLTPMTLDQTCDLAVKEAVRLFHSRTGGLFLVNEKNKLKRVAVYPSTKSLISPRKNGFTHRAYVEKRTIIVLADEINKVHKEFVGADYGSAVFIPLSYHNKSIGTLNLITSKKKYFSNKELEVLKVFGSYVSLAIRKAEFFERLNESLSTRDLFIAMAAHEFRTPLTTINGYLQLLQNKLSEISAPASRWIKELSWETVRLTLLVNELLEISKINTGQLQYVWREHNLKEIIERAILDFQFNYPKRKLVFNNQLGIKSDLIIGDFDKLLQVVNNLLGNASKFSLEDTEINIFLKEKQSQLVLGIQDYGKGIAKKDLPMVFESFYKGKDTFKEGMGLGLFLTKKIIEQHHGSVRINSKEGKGTLVEVSLPKIKHDN